MVSSALPLLLLSLGAFAVSDWELGTAGAAPVRGGRARASLPPGRPAPRPFTSVSPAARLRGRYLAPGRDTQLLVRGAV